MPCIGTNPMAGFQVRKRGRCVVGGSASRICYASSLLFPAIHSKVRGLLTLESHSGYCLGHIRCFGRHLYIRDLVDVSRTAHSTLVSHSVGLTGHVPYLREEAQASLGTTVAVLYAMSSSR
jgi:hypothetical protein